MSKKTMDAYDRMLREIREQVHAITDTKARYAALAMVWESMKGISNGLSLTLKNTQAVQALEDCEERNYADGCDPPAQPPPMDPPPPKP